MRQIAFLDWVIKQYGERLTPRGRYLLWFTVALAVVGLDTRRTQVYVLFAAAAGLLLAAALYALLPPPKVRVDCRLPARATALAPLTIRTRVAGQDNQGKGREGWPDLELSFPRPRKWGGSVRFAPGAAYFDLPPGEEANLQTELRVSRRGRYVLRGAAVRATDPLRLAATRATALADQALLVYPRFYTMEEFMVPLGRRYQPGGIPLSSSTGDAIEFVGTREYRAGDPVKTIHWRSWARRGQPVVKEYQEEYFCRLALVLDTFLPRRHSESEVQAFEAAISVLASIADFFSRSEYVVDILAAGPDIYEVSAGRSLAYLENILDVLACLEPCYDPPFATIGPHLFEKLTQITAVVAVLGDWDAAREQFLRQVRELGTAVRAIVVHDGPTRQPWQHAGSDLGEISLITPADVERRLASTSFRRSR